MIHTHTVCGRSIVCCAFEKEFFACSFHSVRFIYRNIYVVCVQASERTSVFIEIDGIFKMWQRPFLPLVSVQSYKLNAHIIYTNKTISSYDCRYWSIFSCCCVFFSSFVNFYFRFNVRWVLVLARCAFLQIRSVYLFPAFHTFTHANEQTHAASVSLSNLLYHNNEVICCVTLFGLWATGERRSYY